MENICKHIYFLNLATDTQLNFGWAILTHKYALTETIMPTLGLTWAVAICKQDFLWLIFNNGFFSHLTFGSLHLLRNYHRPSSKCSPSVLVHCYVWVGLHVCHTNLIVG
ncbi:hypothetical protein ILYODFUR_004616 [Ilyodon furcidens]|uniref:Uncharacterized protein n=1 Tax=Ilyodon furcidens TaxID=33524 RepID=A0ABV0SU67_9TELE